MQIVRSVIRGMLISLIASLAMMLSLSTVFAAATPLPANEAFIFSLDTHDANKIFVHWQIAPGYYLYRDRLKIAVTPSENVASIDYPQGDFKYAPDRGRMQVFHGDITVPIILKKPITSGEINIDYQGCSQAGFCYPPMHEDLTLGSPSSSSPAFTDTTARQAGYDAASPPRSDRLSTFLTDQNSVQTIFSHHNLFSTLAIFAFIGLLLAFTPCVLPMIPILTGIILGQKGRSSTKKAFLLSGSYVLGASITYALAGLVAAMMGSTLQVYMQQPLFIVAVSIIFVLLAASLFGIYHLRLPHWLQYHIHRAANKHEGGSIVGVFMMGMISTLIVSPCVTAPLLGVLIYIGQTGDKLLGAAALFVMGLGMGIPLLVIGVSAGKWLPRSGPWMIAIKEMFGMLMLGMAIWLLSRVLPFTATRLLWMALITGSLVYILINLSRARRLERKWAYTLGIAAGLTSLILITSNMHDLLNPPVDSHQFVTVRNLAELETQLNQARIEHKPVLIDFYANWCESCVLMEKQVFAKPQVMQALENYKLIRADLSANDINDEKLMEKYEIFAPPTVLFFTPSGQENNSHRIVGEVDMKEFLTRLNTVRMTNCNKKINC